MKIATLLFTYNRSTHTEQVLNSLKHNTVLPEKLIVFQDGLRQGCKDVACEWQKVNTLIRSIDWCNKEIIVSEYNKGLAESIVSGINYVFKAYDAVIVLEDDCVTAPNFTNFMEQCFYKYEKNKMIYSVSGYSWPIVIEKNQYDVYGCGRISTWGWGTWKDRWEKYSIDNDIIKRLKWDKEKSRDLAMWGNDCERMFLDKIVGNNDSWAIYWALRVIEDKGICINPYCSLVQNIGLDGTGVHCGKSDRYQVTLSGDLKQEFELPDNVAILDSTKKAWVTLHGNYTSVNWEDESKEKILVYGLGNFYFQYEKEINEKYYVEAFVDKNKSGWFAGRKIIHIHEIGWQKYDKILIMVQNIQECINIVKELIFEKVCIEKILLGHSFYGNYRKSIDDIVILPDGNLSITVGQIVVKVRSMDEFNNAYEVLVNHAYHYLLNNDKKDVVFDVGMNIGDAALYFLNCEKVKKVYAYEPFVETYLAAKENLKNYLDCPDRIEIFQYGISSENSKRVVKFNADMTCGQSTIGEVREKAYSIYQSMGLVQFENERQELVEVRDVVEEFMPIIQQYQDCNIILKIDCEGEEYGIIEKLAENRTLDKITLIMLEWHYRGKNSILNYLEKFGFSYWCNDKNENMGLIYAINVKRGE